MSETQITIYGLYGRSALGEWVLWRFRNTEAEIWQDYTLFTTSKPSEEHPLKWEVRKVTTTTEILQPKEVWVAGKTYQHTSSDTTPHWQCVHVWEDGTAMLVHPDGTYDRVLAQERRSHKDVS